MQFFFCTTTFFNHNKMYKLDIYLKQLKKLKGKNIENWKTKMCVQ